METFSKMILMKAEKIFTIGSIIAFFALLPALIILQVRVLRMMPEINYLFIIMDIILVGFIALEIFLITRKWLKKKDENGENQEEQQEETIIEKEWDKKEESISNNEGN